MAKYFLIGSTSRAAAYGIGTYAKQMALCVKGLASPHELCFIDLNADVKEFMASRDDDGCVHYQFPAVNDRTDDGLYSKCVLFLLDPYIPKDERLVFHFNYSQHFDMMRMFKARYRQCRIIYTVHYQNWCFSLNGNLTRFRKLISEADAEDEKQAVIREGFWSEKRLFSLCDDIIVLSKFTYSLLKDTYGIAESKLHLVYNGLQKDGSIAPYDINTRTSKEILFVGRLDEIKGIEYIIRAFKKIAEKDSEAHLTLVGDGDFGRYLSLCDGLWDRVTFTGKVPKDRMEQFFSRAAIGVQPSFHEQCSYSAIEMMAHGIPFIATDSTGLGEMMDYTPCNILPINEDDFNAEDFVNGLAGRMTALLSDARLRKESSMRLIELYNDRYSLAGMTVSMNGMLCRNAQQTIPLSEEFLTYLDDEMARLIDTRPAIDFDKVGLTGIGCYLWWRICGLRHCEDSVSQVALARLQEYMIYFIDWVYDVIAMDGDDAFPATFDQDEYARLFSNILGQGFYKTQVQRIIDTSLMYSVDIRDALRVMENTNDDADDVEIVHDALNIYNANL